MTLAALRPERAVITHFLLPLAALCVLLALLPPQAAGLLRYERSLILDGQLWRLLSGHLLHLGWPHLGVNLLALTLICGAFGRTMTPRLWWLTTAAGALGVALGLLLLEPGVSWYVGLSGVLHALFAAGAIHLPRPRWRLSRLLLAGLCMKLIAEQLDYTILPVISSAVLDAHLYGAFMGAILGWALRDRLVAAEKAGLGKTRR